MLRTGGAYSDTGSAPLESEGFAGAGRASKALRSATAINANAARPFPLVLLNEM